MVVASCHCGAVRIEADRKPVSLTQCTCSICHRYGALWFYRTRKTARVAAGTAEVKAYLWGDRGIEFYHCSNCGCLTHYESVTKSDDGRIAINARMLAPEHIEGVRVRTFDGADTWRYID